MIAESLTFPASAGKRRMAACPSMAVPVMADHAAATSPRARNAEHPHREGRLEYKYPEGERSEEDAYS